MITAGILAFAQTHCPQRIRIVETGELGWAWKLGHPSRTSSGLPVVFTDAGKCILPWMDRLHFEEAL